jgi:hypothetical protein
MAKKAPAPALTPKEPLPQPPTEWAHLSLPYNVIPRVRDDEDRWRRDEDQERHGKHSAGGRKGVEKRALTTSDRRDKVRALALDAREEAKSSQGNWAAEVREVWKDDGERPPASTIEDDIRALQRAGELPPCSRR